jgi:hypothetical protein
VVVFRKETLPTPRWVNFRPRLPYQSVQLWFHRWEDLRSKDVKLEKEAKEVSLHRLTSQEREIRKRIEDIMDKDRDNNDAPKVLEKSNPFNGDLAKRGKKRKHQ